MDELKNKQTIAVCKILCSVWLIGDSSLINMTGVFKAVCSTLFQTGFHASTFNSWVNHN